MLNYPRGEFCSCLEEGQDFTSAENVCKKTSLTRGRGELNPGVKLYVQRTPYSKEKTYLSYSYIHVLPIIVTLSSVLQPLSHPKVAWWQTLVMVDPAGDGQVTATRSRDQHLLLCVLLYKPYCNKIWQDARPTSIDLTLHVIMTSLHLSHVTDIHGFFSTSISPITTKLGKMADQQALNLP